MVIVWSSHATGNIWVGRPSDALYTGSGCDVLKTHCPKPWRARVRGIVGFVDFETVDEAKVWCELMFKLRGESYAQKPSNEDSTIEN